MNYLVPVVYPVRIVTEDDIRIIENKLSDVSIKFRKAADVLRSGITALNGLKADVISEINTLDVKISELTADIQRLRKDTFTPTEPPTVSNDHRNIRRACKALYRKIAHHTHPDKTPDSMKHALFVDACEALAKHDLFELERLSDILFKPSESAKYKRTMERLQALKDSLSVKEKELQNLLDSKEYIWASLYTQGDINDQLRALGLYSNHLAHNLNNRKITIHNLLLYRERLKSLHNNTVVYVTCSYYTSTSSFTV